MISVSSRAFVGRGKNQTGGERVRRNGMRASFRDPFAGVNSASALFCLIGRARVCLNDASGPRGMFPDRNDPAETSLITNLAGFCPGVRRFAKNRVKTSLSDIKICFDHAASKVEMLELKFICLLRYVEMKRLCLHEFF